MRKTALFIALLLAAASLAACSNKDRDRIRVLNSMPALWESKVILADPANKALKLVVPLENSYDPGFVEFMKGGPKSGDYIPESVFASATETFRDKPKTITMRVGETVEVLEQKQGRERYPLCLVRTRAGTYAWLYAYHLRNDRGRRLATLTDY